jgi:hypothetical protein
LSPRGIDAVASGWFRAADVWHRRIDRPAAPLRIDRDRSRRDRVGASTSRRNANPAGCRRRSVTGELETTSVTIASGALAVRWGGPLLRILSIGW